MKLLTRYTLGAFIRYLLLAITSFMALFLLVDFFDKIDNFIEHRAGIDLYITYFSALIPGVLTQMMPLATLLAVFLTLGGFNRTSELTAMMAGGISIWRIVAPLCIAGIFLSGLVMLNSELLVPWTSRTANHVLRVQVKGKPELFTTRGKIWYRQSNNYINARFFDAKKGLLEGVKVFLFDDNTQLLQRIDAQSAHYSDEAKTWVLNDGVSYHYANQGRDITAFKQFSELPFDLGKSPADLKTVEPKTAEMTYQQLSQFVDRLQSEGFDPTRYRVAMHQHMASPFSVFVMVLLGIPFALKRGRNLGMAIGVAVSVAVGVAYFVVNATVVAFGASGKLPPFAAAWFANVLFALLAVGLLYRRRI